HFHHTYSLIKLGGEKPTDCCRYCDDTNSPKAKCSKLASLVLLPSCIDTSTSRLNVDVYRLLMNSKWRRHGSHVYKTVNEKTCCPVFTIRCDTEHFRISKTQKRVQMKGGTPNDSKKSQDVCGGDSPFRHSDVITSSSL
ncbi:Arginyl-tRNA--protein transferase 2, partial [Taenia solium]